MQKIKCLSFPQMEKTECFEKRKGLIIGMFGVLEFIIALIFMISIIVFFIKFSKKPPVIIFILCYIFAAVAVTSAGLVATIPMPTEKIQIDLPEDYSVKVYSVRSDGRVYTFYKDEKGDIGLKEVFNNDIGKNLEEAVEIRGKTTLKVPIGEGRCLTFLGEETEKIRVIFGENITMRDLDEDVSDTTEILFENTNRFYDNIIKLLRLMLFVLFIVIIMAFPILFTYKHKFEKYNNFFYNIYINSINLFKSYKLECILCLFSTVLSYFMFLYIDLNSITAWSLESLDATLRGGYVYYADFCAQNLWDAHHGVMASSYPSITYFLAYIWNLPTLLIHYCFHLPYETTEMVMLWSKLLYEILSFAVAAVAYKIIIHITDNTKKALLTFVLIIGSITTFLAVGYAGQDDIIDTFLFCMCIYMTIKNKKRVSLVYMLLLVYNNPQSIILIAVIIFSTSETFKEIILKLIPNFIVALRMLISIESSIRDSGEEIPYFDWFFNATHMPTFNSSISLVSVIIALTCLIGFSFKPKCQKACQKRLLYLLCILSFSILIFTFMHYYRYHIYMILIILGIMTVEDEEKNQSAILGLCLFEYCFSIVESKVTITFLHFDMMSDYIKNMLGVESMPYLTLYDYLSKFNPDISKYLPIVYGIAVACAIWIIYICYPHKKEVSGKFTCNVPKKLVSCLFVSSSIIAMGIMLFIGYRIDCFSYEYSEKATGIITSTNSVQEYYRGKSADWIQVGFKPYIGDMRYSDKQMLNMDIVDVENDEVIGTYACPANKLVDSTENFFIVENINIKNNKWYILKFYFTGISEGEEPVVKLYRTKDGSSKEEKHFALVKENEQTVKVDYDYVGEVFTGKKIL